MEITDENIEIINRLFDLDTLTTSEIDDYIKDMVHSYIRRKKEIVINICGLIDVAPKLSGFVFEGKVEPSMTGRHDLWTIEKLALSQTNLIAANIFLLLPNASTIIIRTDGGFTEDSISYPFSMSCFLSVINRISTWKIIKVEQCIIERDNKDKSWISKVWNAKSLELQKEYALKNLTISFETDVIECGPDGDDREYILYFNIQRKRLT